MQKIIDKMPTGKLKWNSKTHSKQKEQWGGECRRDKQTHKQNDKSSPTIPIITVKDNGINTLIKG